MADEPVAAVIVDPSQTENQPPPPPDDTPPEAVVPSTDQSTAPETETAPDEGVTAPEGEVNEAPNLEDLPEDLSEEDLEQFIEFYGERLAASKGYQTRLDQVVQERVTREVAASRQQATTGDAVQALIQKGERAIQGLGTILDGVGVELAKADRAEEFNAAILKPEEFATHLKDYGEAIVGEVSLRYDKAIEGAVQHVLGERIPNLSEEDAQKFVQIVSAAQRMEGDPVQAPQAKAYLVRSLVSLFMDMAETFGAVKEREAIAKRPGVAKKIVDANTAKAAAAKLAADRGNPPPKAPPSTPEPRGEPNHYDSDYYKRLKQEDPVKAQEWIMRVTSKGRRAVA